MIVRKYRQDDFNKIELVDSFFTIQVKYRQDIIEDNIICLVEDENLLGAGFLSPHQMPDQKHIVDFYTCIDSANQGNPVAESILMDGLIHRFQELSEQYTQQNLCLRIFCKMDQIDCIQFYMNKGFYINTAIPVLKYDLGKNTVHYDIPTDVQIQKYTFNDSTMNQYLNAGISAGIELENEAELWFRLGDPSFSCYTALCNNEVVGAISVWAITNKRAATEYIYTIPSYRRKNIARELISTAIDVLKARNMEIATLSVRGNNLPAIKLYQSYGYTLYYNLVEMIYK